MVTRSAFAAATGNEDHEIIPRPGTAVRERDGAPASLTRPLDYPVVAVCLTCGQPVRCERWFRGEWHHIMP